MSKQTLLEIDAGNTLCKWRIVSATDLLPEALVEGRSAVKDISTDILSALVQNQSADWLNPRFCRLASVLGNDSNECLFEQLKKTGIKEVGQAQVSRKTGRVSCDYKHLAQLGIDRWLAVLASVHHYADIAGGGQQALIIADFGTALNVEIVDPSGVYMGGYIVPGWSMMHSGLQNGTAIKTEHLPIVMQDLSILKAGKTTQEATVKGRLLLFVSLLERLVSQHADARVGLILTGGDAEWVTSYLNIPYIHDANLVMQGLAYAELAITKLSAEGSSS